jgi:ABC-type transport system involved in multi-copper enzyme maturation permease subunit
MSEWRRVSRQPWFYAVRSGLVAGLLAGLAAVWWAVVSRMDVTQASATARAGESYFAVIVLAQLSMVLLAAPASTAGAFSTDMSRGHVLVMLATGLSAAEIIVGTLCARLMTVLAAVASIVPVLAMASYLGGVSPAALIRLEIVTAGCAVLGCALALALSIGARRLHDALMTTYVLLVGWVLGYPVLFIIRMTSLGRVLPAWLLTWFLDVNPYWIVLGPTLRFGVYRSGEAWEFAAGTIVLALGFVGVACWLLRPAVLAVAGGISRRRWLPRFSIFRPAVSLDSHPVFWRECRLQQPSWRLRVLSGFYVIGAMLFTALAVGECTLYGINRTPWAAPFNGFQAAVGLLLLSLTTPAALAEDRDRGSLAVLLSTPLSTRGLVLSKWCAYYRVVPAMAILPAVVALAHAAPRERWIGVPLTAAVVLSYGAAVTSLGIALATWVPRVDRALVLSAAASVLVTVAWIPLAFLLFQDRKHGLAMATASPLLGVGVLTAEMADASPAEWRERVHWAIVWIVAYSGLAVSLLVAAIASFDRCVGRIGRAVSRRRQAWATAPALAWPRAIRGYPE